MILGLPNYSSATRTAMEGVPNIEENALTVFAPLPIPNAQHFDALGGQQFFAGKVLLPLSRCSVDKSIQLDSELCERAIKIEELPCNWMLTTELETSEPTSTKSAPELFFLFGLMTTKSARCLWGS